MGSNTAYVDCDAPGNLEAKEETLAFNAKVERLAQSEPFQNIITSLFCHNVNADFEKSSLKSRKSFETQCGDGIGASDLYAVMPPFEAFAGISAELREKLFLQSLEVGMVLVGTVRSLNSDMGMVIDKPRGGAVSLDLLYCEDQVLSGNTYATSSSATSDISARRDHKISTPLEREVAGHSPLNRYIADLNISVICDGDSMPSRRITEAAIEQIWRVVVKSIVWSPSLVEDRNAISNWAPQQIVGPMILTDFLQIYTADQTKMDDSSNSGGVPADRKQYFFDNLSPSFKRTKLLEQDSNISYDALLHKIVGFSNPKSHSAIMNSSHLVDCKVDVLQSVWVQLCRSHSNSKLRSAATLRKNQNLKRALLSVGKGVTCFKEEKSVEAMQYFNAALEIDSECVEGLVARGALHAKLDVFPSAISDFKAALAIKSSHRNANKYLLETYLTFAQREETSNRLLRAEKLYHEAQEFFVKNHETNAILVAALERIEKLKLQQEEQPKLAPNLMSGVAGATDVSPEKRTTDLVTGTAKDATSELDSSIETSITAKKIQKWLKREKRNLKKRKKKEKEKAEQEKERQRTPEKADTSRKENRSRSRSRTPRIGRHNSNNWRTSQRKSIYHRPSQSHSRSRSSLKSIEVVGESKSEQRNREKSPFTNSRSRSRSRERCNMKSGEHPSERKRKISKDKKTRSKSKSLSSHGSSHFKNKKGQKNGRSRTKEPSPKRGRKSSCCAERRQVAGHKTSERRKSPNGKLEEEKDCDRKRENSRRKSNKIANGDEKQIEQKRRKRSRSSESERSRDRSDSRRPVKKRNDSDNRKSTSKRRSPFTSDSSGSRRTSKSPNSRKKSRCSTTRKRSRSPKRSSITVERSNYTEGKMRKRSCSRSEISRPQKSPDCQSNSRTRKRKSREVSQS